MVEYIERDKIQAVFDGISDCADMVFEPNDRCCTEDDCGGCKWLLTKKAIEKEVMAITAADVRPVAHGKWETETLDSGKFWANYCSNCDYYLPYGLEWKPNYCPNCGAKMED